MTTVKHTNESLSAMNSTEVRKVASSVSIKNYTKYPKTELINMILTTQQSEKAPKSGTKSEKIFTDLKAGEKTMYRIAKDHDTYVSVVLSVKKRYFA